MRGIFPLIFGGFALWAYLDGEACIGTFAVTLFLAALIGLSFNYTTVVDPYRQQVRRKTTGFWGVPGRERIFAFTDFDKVEVYRDEDSCSYQLRLKRGWRCYELTYEDRDMVEAGQELADLMGIPFNDQT